MEDQRDYAEEAANQKKLLVENQRGARCAVCGQPWDFSQAPPIFRMVPDPENPDLIKPMVTRKLRVDPTTGAVCWCRTP